MRNLTVLACLLFCTTISFSQEEFKKKYTVYVKSAVCIYYVPTTPKAPQPTGKFYNDGVNPPITEFTNEINYETPVLLTNSVFFDPKAKDHLDRFSCDIKQDKGKLYLYPWPKGSDVNTPYNTFIRNNSFYMHIGARTRLAVKYSSWHVSAVSIPFKTFLTTANSGALDKNMFAVNVSSAIGIKYGKTHFYYLPNETEGKSYTTLWSLNLLWGINKLDLTDKNIVVSKVDQDKVDADGIKRIDKIKGSYGSLTTGIAAGYHFRSFTILGAIGVDHPFGTVADVNWAYTRQLWIGFGAGFKLLGW